MRSRKLFAASVALGVATLAMQAGGLEGPASAGPSAAGSVSGSAAPTGSSAVVNLGTAGWNVLTSATATQAGAKISAPGSSTAGWLTAVTDGAAASGTEINALLQNR